jgi:hypothetical protein
MRAVWCVAWLHPKTKRKEWCATYRGRRPDPAAAIDHTRCGASVVFRVDHSRRLPTCARCRKRMGLTGGILT